MQTDLLQPNQNHFNLLRLIAAIQVAFFHADALLPQLVNWPLVTFLKKALWYFPGVNIFYFISGFLIWRSFEQSGNNLKLFYLKRVKRIYPGLYGALIFTVICLYIAGQFNVEPRFYEKIVRWFIAQLTLMQYYAPKIFQHYATGIPNGPLWSVAVELQFYLLVPFLYRLLKSKSLAFKNVVIILMSIITFVFNHYQEYFMEFNYRFQVVYFSVLNFFHFFGIGILIYLNFSILKDAFVKNGKRLILLYTFFAILCAQRNIVLNTYEAESFTLVVNLLLALFVFSVAFLPIKKQGYFIQLNDFSYGLYLYHVPIINVILTYGLVSHANAIFWAAAITFAIVSWYIIEKPFLKRK
jgi:peptidoglycan/LPS O-acetylase OafA/YrhL